MYKHHLWRPLSLFKAAIFVFLMMLPFGRVNAQITLTAKQPTLEKVTQQIKNQSDYRFFYDDALASTKLNDIKVKGADICDLLDKLFAGKGISYKIIDKVVYLQTVREIEKAKQSPDKTITGKVTDNSGEPLIGVSIQGSKGGTITDIDGNYSIKVAEGEMLLFSYIGFSPKMIKADGEKLDIVLEDDAEILEGVVVTALGIKREEKALSYNVQEIKGDMLTTVKDANFMNALSGKVAGVNINASSAGVGGATRVVMRGPKSINSSNSALYVIDGIPLFNVNNGEVDGGILASQPGGEGISDINPEDIESVSILSGPAAAALYGSAAAQGVIMITTKKGKAGAVSVAISNNTSFMQATMLPEFQHTYVNNPGDNRTWGAKAESAYGDYDPAGFFRTGYNVQNNVALTLGGEKSQTYISLGTTNSAGILPNSGYDRYNITARNTTSFLDDLLSLDLSVNYIKAGDKNLMAQGQYFNPLPALYLFPRGENVESMRIFEIYDQERMIKTQNWSYGEALNMQNPYWIMNRMVRTNNKERYMMAGALTVKPLKWLDIRGRLRYDSTQNKAEDKRYAGTKTLFAHSPYGYYSYDNTFDKAFYGDVIATVNHTFAESVSLSANIGGSMNYTSTRTEGFRGGLKAPSNVFTPLAIDYASGESSSRPSFYGNNHLIYSAFASAEIGYKRALYLTLTGRNDWDSALAGTSHESFFYPSVGLSTILSEYISFPRNIVSFLKLRGSWASVGSAIPANLASAYRYKFTAETGGYETLTYRFPSTFYPERTDSWEAGLNGRFFNDFWNLDVTLYQSNTKNQTFERTISASEGFNKEYIQAGNVRNRGIELSTSLNFEFGEFNWTPRFTFSINENKIISLLPNDNEIIDKGGLQGIKVILKKGGTMGDVYDYTDIRYDAEGYPLVEGNNLKIDGAIKNPVYRGTTLPLANLSLVNDFSWKGLDFGFQITGRLGGIVMSQTQAILDYYGVSQHSADLRDAGGVPLNLGRISAEKYLSATGGEAPLWRNYIYDATNVRLQEAHIGYTLPCKWITKKATLSFGITGHNLFMIYVKAPFDPELTASTGTYYQGFDYFMQPALRNFGFNVRLKL